MQIRLEANELMSQCILLTNAMADQQQTTLSVLAALDNGVMHPYLLSTKDIKRIMEQLNLSGKGHTSYVSFTHFSALRKIIRVKHVHTRGRTIVKLEIPLPMRGQFNIHKIYYVPFFNASMVLSHYSPKSFMVTDDRNEKLWTATAALETQCKYLNLQDTIHEEIICNTKFLEAENLNRSCIYAVYQWKTISYNGDRYVELHNPNQWLWISKDEVEGTITCKKEELPIVLNPPGILKMRQGCQTTIGGVNLTTHRTRSTASKLVAFTYPHLLFHSHMVNRQKEIKDVKVDNKIAVINFNQL